MDVKGLLDKGFVGLVVRDAKKEATSEYKMRGGNSGAIINGKAYGNCARLAHLRLKGFQEASNKTSQMMFMSGRAMEGILLELIEASGFPMSQVKREEEDPVAYTHTSGVPIAGRPDFVFFDEAGKRVGAIECKGKMSYWGVRNLLVEHTADTAHLVQAAHYMWAHGLTTYALVYVVPVKYPIQSKRGKTTGGLSFDGFELLSEEYVEFRGDYPSSVLPNIYTIQLSTEADNTLSVTMHNGKKYSTALKYEHIQAFYGAVAGMGEGAELPPIPTSGTILKGGKAGYKKCTYCVLKPVCDAQTDYDSWLDKAVDKLTESWAVTYPDLLDSYLEGWPQEEGEE